MRYTRISFLMMPFAAAAMIGCGEGGLGGGRAADPELASGTRIVATAGSTVTSESNAVGDVITASVSSDVADSAGNVVIPAGSEIALRITAIAPGPNRGDRGTLTFDVQGITIAGEQHSLDARVVDYAYDMRGTGVGAEEVAKTAAGAAAGAIIGGVAGGEDKVVIGGVAGAAAGAAIADRTQDRHIVVAAGNRIELELTGEFDG
jgi:hypothetical protein